MQPGGEESERAQPVLESEARVVERRARPQALHEVGEAVVATAVEDGDDPGRPPVLQRVGLGGDEDVVVVVARADLQDEVARGEDRADVAAGERAARR